MMMMVVVVVVVMILSISVIFFFPPYSLQLIRRLCVYQVIYYLRVIFHGSRQYLSACALFVSKITCGAY